MAKNKSVFLFTLLFGVFLVSGCVQQPDLGKGGTTYNIYFPPKDHTYLSDVLASSAYISKGQQFEVNFVIQNPLQQSVDNVVEMSYDISSCFTDSWKTTVPTPPKTAVSSGKSIKVPSNIDSKCFGTRTLTVVILDKNGALIDYSNLLINIKTD